MSIRHGVPALFRKFNRTFPNESELHIKKVAWAYLPKLIIETKTMPSSKHCSPIHRRNSYSVKGLVVLVQVGDRQYGSFVLDHDVTASLVNLGSEEQQRSHAKLNSNVQLDEKYEITVSYDTVVCG